MHARIGLIMSGACAGGIETLEEKLDRLNFALKFTVQDLDYSMSFRDPSPFTNLNSGMNSFCGFESVEQELRPGGSVEEGIEFLLMALDRAQMQAEDLWSEAMREREAKALRKQQKEVIKGKIAELDLLAKSMNEEQITLKLIEKKLKLKESELDLREQKVKEKEDRLKVQRSQEGEEKNKELDSWRANVLKPKDLNSCENLDCVECDAKVNLHVEALRLKVKDLEEVLNSTKNAMHRTKVLKQIATVKNEIAMVRAEYVVKGCVREKGREFYEITNKGFINREKMCLTPKLIGSGTRRFAF